MVVFNCPVQKVILVKELEKYEFLSLHYQNVEQNNSHLHMIKINGNKKMDVRKNINIYLMFILY